MLLLSILLHIKTVSIQLIFTWHHLPALIWGYLVGEDKLTKNVPVTTESSFN